MRTNTQVLIKALPEDKLTEDHYELVDGVIDEPSEGRCWYKRRPLRSLRAQGQACRDRRVMRAPKTGIVMNGTGVGHVVVSKDPAFKEGDAVLGPTGWQQYPSTKAQHSP